jgi:two-component system sensor histidine kinase BaeS
MQNFISFSSLSLRVKLVLSYLAVTLGAILVLAFAVAIAVQGYFISAERSDLQRRAEFQAQHIEFDYQQAGATWNNFTPQMVATSDPVLLDIVDSRGNLLYCGQPVFLLKGNCSDPTLRQALNQSLQGKEVDGNLQVTTQEGSFASLYVSIPLQYNGQIIGAMFLSAPESYPPGFLEQVNQAIIIAGFLVALIVMLFSLFLARSLTRPLESLTRAAEQMKQGKYTQRVEPPKSQDELGQLAQTFNAMADTIEADVNELRRQDQVRLDLLANIAHDLATPLTAIQGFSEALADDVITDPTARQETAQRIAREVQRLRRLVADVQQMSSLETGHTRLDLAPLDMHTLVNETLAVIEPECEQMGITLSNTIAPNTPLVLADSDRITQVLLNLLDNARRHTPRDGKITVGATPVDKSLRVWISDTGAGINPEDLPHIFERFYRADRSRTGATGGSGLGLSIVRAIITAHNGTIKAESSPGRGTRITFTLPLAERPSMQGSDSLPAGARNVPT